MSEIVAELDPTISTDEVETHVTHHHTDGDLYIHTNHPPTVAELLELPSFEFGVATVYEMRDGRRWVDTIYEPSELAEYEGVYGVDGHLPSHAEYVGLVDEQLLDQHTVSVNRDANTDVPTTTNE